MPPSQLPKGQRPTATHLATRARCHLIPPPPSPSPQARSPPAGPIGRNGSGSGSGSGRGHGEAVIPVTISFRDLSMTVVQRGFLGAELGRKQLLNKISADCLPGRLVAIMGSSGAGKVLEGALSLWGGRGTALFWRAGLVAKYLLSGELCPWGGT